MLKAIFVRRAGRDRFQLALSLAPRCKNFFGAGVRHERPSNTEAKNTRAVQRRCRR
jgi:hypothetical protein